MPLLAWAWLANVPGAEHVTPQTFNSNGVKIAYIVQGQGEPVVLIHGWLSSAGINWVLPGTFAMLAKNYQVVALDMRGHGLSEQANQGRRLWSGTGGRCGSGSWIIFEIKKAHIVGYSMGGIVAGNFIANHPERVISRHARRHGLVEERRHCGLEFCPDRQERSACPSDGALRPEPAQAGVDGRRNQIHPRPDKDDCRQQGWRDNSAVSVFDFLQRELKWPVTWIKGADHITCILKPEFREAIAAWIKQNSADEQAKQKTRSSKPPRASTGETLCRTSPFSTCCETSLAAGLRKRR